MSELKRNHSLYSRVPAAGRAAARATPVAQVPKPATDAAELRLLEPFEIMAVQGGDPYNGVGSRAMTAPRTLRK
jgi:hypothetical protein